VNRLLITSASPTFVSVLADIPVALLPSFIDLTLYGEGLAVKVTRLSVTNLAPCNRVA
jgi:hypothetical protein